MQKKWILFGIASLLAMSCSTQPKQTEVAERAPQAAAAAVSEEDAQHEASFKAAMNAEGQNEDEKNAARVREMSRYLNRQISFFYMAQSALIRFDKQLDIVHKRKMKNPSAEIDPSSMDQERLQMNIAWEFSERNLHELQYIYKRLLQEAHNPSSDYQKASSMVLSNMDKNFGNLWSKGERWAAISLAEDFENINQDFEAQNPQAKLPNFRQYSKVSGAERTAAYNECLKTIETRKKNHFDTFLQKQWEKFKAERQKEQEQNKERTPQSDTLYPDPGGNGNITGNRFDPGVWALTLDDGPHPTYTPGMINAIQGAGLKATFFWLSQNLKAYPSLPKLAADAGFRRGSHSYSHANLPTLGENGLHHEIDEAAEVFTDVVGQRPTFFRCPYGACGGNNSRIRQKIAGLKMMHVFWNVDSLDWQDKNPNSIFERVRKQMEVNGHGIILLHDIHPQSVEAMKLIVAYIKSHSNLSAHTMDEIMKLETGSNYDSP